GAGMVGLAGPRAMRDDITRWIVAQLAVHVSPADLDIVLVPSASDRWRWARWLPHLHRPVATTAERGVGVPAEIREQVRRRSAASGPASRWPGRWVLLVVDPLTDTCPPVAPELGVTALVVADRVDDLPTGCAQVVVVADGETGSRVTILAGDAPVEVAADRVDGSWADDVARALAPLRDEPAESAADLPTSCRLVDLLDLNPVSAAAVQQRWRRATGAATTLIGVSSNGPVTLDLDHDGPHVLVAGSTGAGKSELLQTLVCGLAVAHPPTQLTFLLIDYKGGSAFAGCARLPHTVGLVTDLDDQLTRRVLAALDSEIRRREQILAAAGARDLAEYRAGPGQPEPLPRVVLIVDEFAALAEELADFVPGLVGIARRGRSLGLHLVLATQRPAGVVSPEVRANAALRICLRVTSPTDSLDVIDTADAAAIPQEFPGRGFARIASGLAEIQTARVAAPGPIERPDRARVVPLDQWRRRTDTAEHDTASDLDRIVTAARLAAADLPRPRRPWLPPLPDRLAITDVPAVAAPPVVPIGLVDLPDAQAQLPLTIDLSAGGTVLVVGRPRSGRSSALHVTACSAARRLPPADLHVHAIDAGGTALVPLRALPHTGTIATSADGFDVMARLARRIRELAGARRTTNGHGPNVLLLVDGWDRLVAGAEEHDGGRTVDVLVALMRDAPGTGITVVVAGGRGALTPRLTALVHTRLVLAMSDAGDYAAAGVDRSATLPGGTAGRGVRAGDGAAFQLALPPDIPDVTPAPVPGPGRIHLRPLPARVNLRDLAAVSDHVTLGVGGDEASALSVDLGAGAARLLVAGPPRSGRSTLLATILAQWRGSAATVAAPHRSPLAGATAIRPGDPARSLPDRGLLVVDDVEAFADCEIGDTLAEWVRAGRPGRIAVVAGRSDALAVSRRSLAADVRESCCGVLLQPVPADGDLLAVAVPRVRATPLPGRGLLVADPAWRLGTEPIPFQAAIA
ncbi:MAG: FtsK/SpoIIIE domain-containing protein, partial [Jatrophihabitantaceae bacterium]